MNNHNGTLHRGWQSFQRWRIQIFVITWLAYAAFYFTRKAFSVAKLGIAEDPSFELDKSAMADLDALYLAAYAVGQFMWGGCSPTASAPAWWCSAVCSPRRWRRW